MAVGELVVNIIGDMKELSKTFSSVQKELDTVGKKFNDVGKTMSSAGKTMSTYVTAPVLGLGAISLHTASNFDDAMRRVQAVSGSTGAEFEQLSRQARDLGASTSFSASDAADAMYYLALAGWKTNAIMDATPGLLSLAAAAGMELGTAADIVSDTMSAFQMEASLAGTAADIFAAASSNSNTDVSLLGEAMKYAGAAANAAGMDLAQTATVLGILADSGIKGSMAGTTVNAMLRDMKQSAEDGAISIGEQTIAIYDQDGAMRDLGSIMADIEKATAGMTVQQRDAALSSIFQEQSIRGVNIMLATGSERYQELEGKIKDSDGAAKRMAETMEGGVGGAMRELESAFEELLIVIGNILIVAVLPLILGLTDLFNWFSSLPEPVIKIIAVIATLLAAIGPILIIIGAVVSAIGTLATALGSGGVLAGAFVAVKAAIASVVAALGTFALPIALVIAAVAGLALAWRNNWFDIQGKANAVWKWLKTQSAILANRLEYYYHAIVMAVSMMDLSGKWDKIKSQLLPIYEALIDGTKNFYDDLKKYWDDVVTALEPVKQNLSSAWDSIKTIWETFKTSFLDSMSTLYENVKKALEPLRDTLDELCQQLKEDVIPVVLDFLGSFSGSAMDDAQGDIDSLTGIINFLSEKLREFFDWVARHPEITEFVATVAAMAVAIPVILGLLAAAIVLFVAKVVSLFIELVKAAYDLYTDWKDHFENLKTTVTQAIDNIIAKVRGWYTENVNKFNQIKSAALDLLNNWRTHWENFKTTLNLAVANIIAKLQSWYTDVQNRFNQVKAAALDLLSDWRMHWENFKTELRNAVSDVIAKLTELYNSVKKKFDDIVTTARTLLSDWKQHWDDMVAAIKNKTADIISAIDSIVTEIKGKVTDFKNAGKAIIQALKDGIEDKIQGVKDSINGLLTWVDEHMPHSPAEKGPLSRLPNFSSYITTPLKKSVAEASSTAKSAGSSIMNSVATGVKNAASKVSNSLSSTFKKVRKYLPFSPAEFGPFSEIPDWDSVFVEPMLESIKKTGKLAVPLEAALSRVKSPVDSFSSGLGNISSISNTINNAGDTITIGPNTLASGVDIRMLIEELNKYTANKRRARGLYK